MFHTLFQVLSATILVALTLDRNPFVSALSPIQTSQTAQVGLESETGSSTAGSSTDTNKVITYVFDPETWSSFEIPHPLHGVEGMWFLQETEF